MVEYQIVTIFAIVYDMPRISISKRLCFPIVFPKNIGKHGIFGNNEEICFPKSDRNVKLKPPYYLAKMAKKLDTTYKSARFGNCTYTIILDKRHPKKDRNTFPVAMRYTIDRKSWYNFVASEFMEEDSA